MPDKAAFGGWLRANAAALMAFAAGVGTGVYFDGFS